MSQGFTHQHLGIGIEEEASITKNSKYAEVEFYAVLAQPVPLTFGCVFEVLRHFENLTQRAPHLPSSPALLAINAKKLYGTTTSQL